jgi:hypothetical protein
VGNVDEEALLNFLDALLERVNMLSFVRSQEHGLSSLISFNLIILSSGIRLSLRTFLLLVNASIPSCGGNLLTALGLQMLTNFARYVCGLTIEKTLEGPEGGDNCVLEWANCVFFCITDNILILFYTFIEYEV